MQLCIQPRARTMITLRGRLPFALPLKQRCCRRRRRGLRSDRVSPQRRSLHTRERASERSSSQVNESNRSATSFSPPSPCLLLCTLWNLNLPVPLPLPPPLNRLNIGAKMQECVCGGPPPRRLRGQDCGRRTGWRSCSQTDNKMDQGIGGSPTKK